MLDQPPIQPRRWPHPGLLALLVILLIYVLITAQEGYQVGHTIAVARQNPVNGFVSGLAGRDRTEQFAIGQLSVPRWVTASPSFWIALRLSE